MSRELQFAARASLAFVHDVTAAGLAWFAAYWLRFNLEMPPGEFLRGAIDALPGVLAVHAVAFWSLGLYRGLWRYASLPDLRRIVAAVGLAALAVPALLTLAGGFPAAAQVPPASPEASPVAQRWVVVAYIGAEEWAEPLPAVEPGMDLGDRTLAEALQEGGFLIYIRHAATDTAVDQDVDLRYCSTQRNLSQRGKDQAAGIGAGGT